MQSQQKPSERENKHLKFLEVMGSEPPEGVGFECCRGKHAVLIEGTCMQPPLVWMHPCWAKLPGMLDMGKRRSQEKIPGDGMWSVINWCQESETNRESVCECVWVDKSIAQVTKCQKRMGSSSFKSESLTVVLNSIIKTNV